MRKRNQFFRDAEWWLWAGLTLAAACSTLIAVWLVYEYRHLLIFCLVAGVSGMKGKR